ncbi:ABC transporter substrate-binding protein [Microvirga sp. W0021]|uniref:ABC transporter substrate-binding protein n=1 Tax=Hohaiivirga grylli TaxID=3133970 RepID=A0ABV0BKP3_9HYPH
MKSGDLPVTSSFKQPGGLVDRVLPGDDIDVTTRAENEINDPPIETSTDQHRPNQPMLRFLAALTVTFSCLITANTGHAEPKRIVSLNPCLDTVLIYVADREQIAALSHYGRDPESSTISEIAKDLPYVSDSAEEILSLKPDLILSAGHSSPATRKALEQMGLPSQMFTVPNTLQDNYEQIRRIASLVGHPDRGEALISTIDTAINQMRPASAATRYKTLILQSSGLVAGSGTLIDEMMTIAGLDNAASQYGISQWGTVSLEQLIADPPQLLLMDMENNTKPTWADRILHHPALTNPKVSMKRAPIPQPFLYCGGPVIIKTAEALKKARDIMEKTP